MLAAVYANYTCSIRNCAEATSQTRENLRHDNQRSAFDGYDVFCLPPSPSPLVRLVRIIRFVFIAQKGRSTFPAFPFLVDFHRQIIANKSRFPFSRVSEKLLELKKTKPIKGLKVPKLT